MQARDVMVSPVVTVKPSASVTEAAKLLLDRRISAVPVVDDQGTSPASSARAICCIAQRPALNGGAPGGRTDR
jgi:CBS domain-containing protein